MGRREREIADALTTADLWKLMRRRAPPIVSEYFRGGADGESALRGNVRAFQQSLPTAYGAVSYDTVDMRTSVVGHDLAVPWLISPVGSSRTLYPMGDAVASRVAGDFGTVMTQSTLSGTPLEDVAAASSGACWYQLYLCGGRDTALRAIDRARKAGFTALVVTIDSAVAGLRILHTKLKPDKAMGPYRGLTVIERVAKAFRKLRLAPEMLLSLIHI